MDLVLLVDGLAVLMLGVIPEIRQWQSAPRLQWRWLAACALLHAVSVWLGLFAVAQSHSLLAWLRFGLLSVSFVALVEFGRRGALAQGRRAPGGWLAAPLLALAGLSAQGGLPGLGLAACLAVGLPGGLLAGAALWREAAGGEPRRRCGLRLAAAALVGLAPATALAVRTAWFPPAVGLDGRGWTASALAAGALARLLCAAACVLGLYLVPTGRRQGSEESGWFAEWVIPVALAVLLLCGWGVTNGVGRAADREFRAALLGVAAATAETVPPASVQGLAFTAADARSPLYQRLCTHLRAFQEVSACRGIYSIARRPGGYVFGPESYPLSDPLASPAGTRYEQPPPEVDTVFSRGQARVYGPYTDEYGSFITALSPIHDPVDGHLLMVIGVDVKAVQWRAVVRRERQAPILFTLALALILLGGRIVLERRSRLAAPLPRGYRHAEVVIIAACGISVSVFAAHSAARGQEQFGRSLFRSVALAQAGHVRATFLDIGHHQLANVAGFAASTPQLTSAAFGKYAALMDPRASIQAVEWIPAVPAAERERWEARARAAGLTGYTIWQRDAAGRRVPAGGRPVFYPVFGAAPLAGNERALGFDLGSEPVRRAALETAGRTGLCAATEPVVLVQDRAHESSILVAQPVFASSAPAAALRGFALLVLRLGGALRAAAASGPTDGLQTIMELYQLRPGRTARCLASTVPHGSECRLEDAWTLVPVFVHDQTLALAMRPGPGFLGQRPFPAGTAVLLLGLLVTAAFGRFVSHVLRRRAVLEGEVARRTAALRESEAFQAALMEHLPVGVMIVDPVTREIEQVNARAAAMFGAEPDELIGRRCCGTVCPAANDECLAVDYGPAVQNAERVMVRADGSRLPVLKAVIRVRHQGQEKLLECMVDITDRKRAEEALVSANHELQAAITRANDMAAEAACASEAKGQFLAHMSHEIRTPLNGVVGMTELLLGTELTPEQLRYARLVSASGEALLSVINDILDFSKIEARRLELETTDFDLRLVLEDATELLALKAEEKGLELTAVIDGGVPTLLRGDPARLRQILLNLGGNAVKFTPQGSVTVHASLEAQADQTVTVRFTVVDTGVGMPADRVGLLFAPFTQLDASITRHYGGTGLGLAISKELAELMGGRIGASSVEGAGSTFWFTAVFTRGQALPEPVPEAAVLDGLRALVVDDHAPNRLLVTALLRSWGCRSEEAADGQTALAALRAAAAAGEPYQVALLDRMMPGLDGLELGRRIQAEPALAPTRLVLLTSLSSHTELEQVQSLGFAGYVTKPLRSAVLRRCLALAVGGGFEPPSLAPVTPAAALAGGTRTGRILLAEDNPTNQIVALALLKKAGYEADGVGNGQEALEALRTAVYDLVLMDCQMPGMDGFEAARLVRSGKAGALDSDVPIVAMTAHAVEGYRAQCLAAGMDDYLTKPVRAHELEAMIEHWLTARPRTTAERPGPAEADAPERSFDPAVLLEAVMDDRATAASVLRRFLDDLPRRVEAVTAAVADGNCAAAAKHAHYLGGGSATVGADRFRAVAGSLELASAADDLGAARRLAGRLADEQQRLIAQVEVVLEAWRAVAPLV